MTLRHTQSSSVDITLRHTLQHTATHPISTELLCPESSYFHQNTLQHTATHRTAVLQLCYSCVAACCSVSTWNMNKTDLANRILNPHVYTKTHCNTLQHTATHRSCVAIMLQFCCSVLQSVYLEYPQSYSCPSDPESSSSLQPPHRRAPVLQRVAVFVAVCCVCCRVCITVPSSSLLLPRCRAPVLQRVAVFVAVFVAVC